MLQCCMVSPTGKFKTGGEILVRFPQQLFSHVFTLVGKDSFSSQSENTASICTEYFYSCTVMLICFSR